MKQEVSSGDESRALNSGVTSVSWVDCQYKVKKNEGKGERREGERKNERRTKRERSIASEG